jgi:hypothetical protein
MASVPQRLADLHSSPAEHFSETSQTCSTHLPPRTPIHPSGQLVGASATQCDPLWSWTNVVPPLHFISIRGGSASPCAVSSQTRRMSAALKSANATRATEVLAPAKTLIISATVSHSRSRGKRTVIPQCLFRFCSPAKAKANHLGDVVQERAHRLCPLHVKGLSHGSVSATYAALPFGCGVWSPGPRCSRSCCAACARSHRHSRARRITRSARYSRARPRCRPV